MLKGHETGVYSLANLGNGYIASGSCQMPKGQERWSYQTYIWDLRQDEYVSSFEQHEGAISELKSCGPNLLASSSADRTVKITDTRDGNVVTTFNGHKDYVYACENIDEGLIASGSRDKTVKVWDLKQPSLPILSLDQSAGTIFALKYLGNNCLASAGADQKVRISDIESGDTLQILECPAAVYRLALLGSKTLVAALSKEATSYSQKNNVDLVIWKFA